MWLSAIQSRPCNKDGATRNMAACARERRSLSSRRHESSARTFLSLPLSLYWMHDSVLLSCHCTSPMHLIGSCNISCNSVAATSAAVLQSRDLCQTRPVLSQTLLKCIRTTLRVHGPRSIYLNDPHLKCRSTIGSFIVIYRRSSAPNKIKCNPLIYNPRLAGE